jgi:hypothetical protein
MEGTPLADAMRSPSRGLAKRQHAEGAVLRPVVTSLQQEAKLEVAAGR